MMTKGLPLIALMMALAPAANAQTNPPAPTPTPAPAPAPAPGATPAPGQSGGLVVDVEGGMSAPMGIAIPALPTPEVASTAAGSTDQLGKQLSDVITADLKNSGLFKPLPVGQLMPVPFAQATAPDFTGWTSRGASARPMSCRRTPIRWRRCRP